MWGNYKDASGKISENLTTGASEKWKAKNLYDVAGNAEEVTMEAVSYDVFDPLGGNTIGSRSVERVSRGGSAWYYGNLSSTPDNLSMHYPASGRSGERTGQNCGRLTRI